MKIEFPKTDYVKCVYSLENSFSSHDYKYDESGRAKNPKDLKEYIYYVSEGVEGTLDVGDYVLVRNVNGYAVCQVSQVNVIVGYAEESKPYAPIVCKVDLSKYFVKLEEQQMLKQMKEQLDKKKRQLEKSITYDLIAEKFPEFKAMLDEYKNAGGTF